MENTGTHSKLTISTDISPLTAILNYFHPISEVAQQYLKEHIYPCSFGRGKLLLKAGQVCEMLFY